MPHREDAPPRPDNGTSYASDGPLSPYDVPSYAAHFHRPRTTARRTRTMDRCPLTTFRRTRRISIVRGQRRVVRVRWTVVPLRCSVVRGAFPSSADNGTSYAYDGPSSPYDDPSYAAHFHRPADNGASYAYDGPLSAYDVPSYAAQFHLPRTSAFSLRTT